MLLNPLEHLSEGDLNKAIVPGLVITNNDPSGGQKIQVRVSILHQGIADIDLPYARPIKSGMVLGSGPVCTISVPPVGSIAALYITTEEDIYNIYYLGVFTLDGTLPSAFTSIFPNCYGYLDANGSLFVVNTATQTTTFTHCSGAIISVTSSAIDVISAGQVNVHATGTANIYGAGGVNIDGPTINLNGGVNPAIALATNPQTAPPPPPNVSNLINY